MKSDKQNIFTAKPLFIVNKVNQKNIDNNEFIEHCNREYNEIKNLLGDYHVLYFVDNKPNLNYPNEINYDVRFPNQILDIEMSELLEMVEHNLTVNDITNPEFTKAVPLTDDDDRLTTEKPLVIFDFIVSECDIENIKFTDFCGSHYNYTRLFPDQLKSIYEIGVALENVIFGKDGRVAVIRYYVDPAIYKQTAVVPNKFFEFNTQFMNPQPFKIKRYLKYTFVKKYDDDLNGIKTYSAKLKYFSNIENVDSLDVPKDNAKFWNQIFREGWHCYVDSTFIPGNNSDGCEKYDFIFDLQTFENEMDDRIFKWFMQLNPQFAHYKIDKKFLVPKASIIDSPMEIKDLEKDLIVLSMPPNAQYNTKDYPYIIVEYMEKDFEGNNRLEFLRPKVTNKINYDDIMHYGIVEARSSIKDINTITVNLNEYIFGVSEKFDEFLRRHDILWRNMLGPVYRNNECIGSNTVRRLYESVFNKQYIKLVMTGYGHNTKFEFTDFCEITGLDEVLMPADSELFKVHFTVNQISDNHTIILFDPTRYIFGSRHFIDSFIGHYATVKKLEQITKNL